MHEQSVRSDEWKTWFTKLFIMYTCNAIFTFGNRLWMGKLELIKNKYALCTHVCNIPFLLYGYVISTFPNGFWWGQEELIMLFIMHTCM